MSASPIDVPSGPQRDQIMAEKPGPGFTRDDSYLRFVGDLSPEASFLANSKVERHHGNRNVSRHDDVGVWLGQKPEDSQMTDSDGPVSGPVSSGSMLLSTATNLQTLRDSLRQESMTLLPPPYEYSLLFDLFFLKIDPIFPIIHGERLDDYPALESIALKQCVCLVAALDPSSRRYLRLPNIERVLSPIEFRTRIAAAVHQSLSMGFIKDTMVLLQICALMAMWVEKPGCSELSTYYCSQVVHHSQTLGLHVGWPHDAIGVEKSRRIFWCVWVLDRLNAATNGRPVLMHK